MPGLLVAEEGAVVVGEERDVQGFDVVLALLVGLVPVPGEVDGRLGEVHTHLGVNELAVGLSLSVRE